MSDPARYRRVDCENCDGVAGGALPRLMDEPLCRQCREDARDE